jgi:tetratricopeptide (TPR) repeat protein
MKKTLLFLALFLTTASLSFAQSADVSTPRESQAAKVSQRIGLTDIEVSYHRPGVKGRKIWDGLVPYDSGKPFPWRGGANENTTISFSTDVKIEGKPLAAGIYGLHIIPAADQWIFIFSKNSWSWGSFTYDEKEDALRVTVKPEATEFTEYLRYQFDDPNPEDTKLTLYWEKIKAGFKINVDVKRTVVENIHKQLQSEWRFTWSGYNSAAMYCVDNNVNLDEALTWADRSIQGEARFENLDTKAQILTKLGRTKEADSTKQLAFDKATPLNLYFYGRGFLEEKKMKEAMDVFDANMKRNPKHWSSFAGMARYYQTNGDKDKAITNLKKAIDLAPDNIKVNLNVLMKQWQG